MGKYNLSNSIRPKSEKKRTYVFTEETLAQHDKELIERARPDIIGHTVTMMTLASMLVCRDKLHYGQIRMLRHQSQIQDVYEAISQGYIKTEDICRQLYEECGVRMVVNRPDGTEQDAEQFCKEANKPLIWRLKADEIKKNKSQT